jgi:hypothetical protein
VNNFILPNKAARLIVLQRIELLNPFLKKIRKLFGRRLFSSLITKFFLNPVSVSKNYYSIMSEEFQVIKNNITKQDKLLLSIGGGVGGLEAIINKNQPNKDYYFIERNYVSKKVKYGWGGVINDEAYNNLSIQKNFLNLNGLKDSNINIFDYDKHDLPKIKFDIIISLFSLDYHYDFNLYHEYLKNICKPSTKIIFDTIRADYFFKFFNKVKVIKEYNATTHKSRRIVCSEFLEKSEGLK